MLALKFTPGHACYRFTHAAENTSGLLEVQSDLRWVFLVFNTYYQMLEMSLTVTF